MSKKSIFEHIKGLIHDIFFVKTWTAKNLAAYARYLKKYNVLPDKSGLPDYIEFPSYFWDRIKQLRRYTDKDGHEYASSVYVVDDDIILTPFIRGEPSHVNIKYHIKWHYEPLDNNRYVKKVYINNQNVLTKTVYKYQIPQKLYSTYLFSVHTHPYHADLGKYGFYSNQDIMSLLQSSSYCMGLITDVFYLIFKTKKAVESYTPQKAPSLGYLKTKGFVVYGAEFGRKLVVQ